MRFLALGGLLVLATAASAQNAYFTGDLTANDPSYNRTFEDGTGLSSTGSNVHYDVQPFYVSASGTFTFESVSPTTTNYDTFIFIYKTAFNPATPLVNYLTGNDDFTGGFTILPGPYGVPLAGTGSVAPAQSSRVSGVALTTGVQYYAINTSFSSGATGTYFSGIGGNSVTGAPIQVNLGLIPTVPEPASMAALALGAAALLRRRRKN